LSYKKKILRELIKYMCEISFLRIKLTANVQGFVQVWELAFRLLVNVSQIYRFKLKLYFFAQ